MKIRIQDLCAKRENDYESFVLSFPSSLLYQSMSYRHLIEETIHGQSRYLIAVNEENQIVGALPAFMSDDKGLGRTLNSLPFFGSNGGVITGDNTGLVAKKLLNEFNRIAKESHCVSSTIITSPLDSSIAIYEEEYDHDFKDKRIGQITALPKYHENLEDNLLAIYHPKTRNAIRKAERSGFELHVQSNINYLQFIFTTHQDNMMEIGGKSKPWKFFESLPKYFKEGGDYSLYIATLRGQAVSALLVFWYNKTAEYFTPATVKNYRSLQPASWLIYRAMRDAVRRGMNYWNWGGTWLNQGGVYDFKKRWATVDYPYYYYTRVYDGEILKKSRDELLASFPNFFVVPFSALNLANQK